AAEKRLEQAKATLAATRAQVPASIKQADKSLDAAKAAVEMLTKATHPQARASCQAAVNEAKGVLDTAQRGYGRQQELVARGFQGQGTLETARAKAASARAALDTAQKRLDTLTDQQQQELASTEAQKYRAEAALAEARAGNDQIKVQEKNVEAAQASVQQEKA